MPIKHKIPLIADYCHPDAREAQMQVLSTSHIEKGEHVPLLEQEFASVIGSEEAVAFNSCTSGIFLSLFHALWKLDPRVEQNITLFKEKYIIAPPVTYIGALHSPKWFGLKLLFPDIIEETLTMDPNAIEELIIKHNTEHEKKILGILAIHPFGMPCDLSPIYELAEKHGLFIIEDIAEALGSTYKGQMLGAQSTYGCFSLNPTKHISAGSVGGIVTTNDPSIALWLREKRHFGFNFSSQHIKHKHFGAGIGMKMFMPNDHAAAGRVSLKLLTQFLEERDKKAKYYMSKLDHIIEFLPRRLKGDRTCSWYVLLGYHGHAILINKELERRGIQSMAPYRCDLAPIFREQGYTGESLHTLHKVNQRLLGFPLHAYIKKKEMDYIIEQVLDIIRSLQH